MTGSGPSADDVRDARIACLAGLPHMTGHRLSSLFRHHDLELACAVAEGRARASGPTAALFEKRVDVRDAWRSAMTSCDVDAMAARLRETGTQVVRPTDPLFPQLLVDDPRCPAVLFVRGRLDALGNRRVGVVGTRNATLPGRQLAARVGFELASSGVAVVSGLALGVDGAAHRGAITAQGTDTGPVGAPVAIVGSGPDVPYPRRHRQLWHDVVASGVLISEWPPGARPEPFHFPLRNRLIAALSELLLVVESRERGGSLITAREAAERGVDVFAVPGAVTSPAAQGTNLLLRDGAAVFTDTADLIAALGLDTRRVDGARIDTRERPAGPEHVVLEHCRRGPQSIDGLARVTGLELTDVALMLARLEQKGWLREVAGWFEPCDPFADLV